MGDNQHPRQHGDWPQVRWPFSFSQIADLIFGYDFFIWYDERDGTQYPEELAQKLTTMGFRVCIDRGSPSTDQTLDPATSRLIGKSRYLLIVGDKHALDSDYVQKLITTGASVMLVDLNQSIDQIDESHPLFHTIQKAQKTINEEKPSRKAPSLEALASIQFAFSKVRQAQLRTRFLTASFLLLALFTVWQFTPSPKQSTTEIHSPDGGTALIGKKQQAAYDANYALARILENKAQTAAAAGRHHEAWLYTLSALQKDIGPHYTLPESHGALFNTAQMRDIFTGAWKYTAPNNGSLYDVAYSPEGSYLAAGSGSSSLRVWNARTGQFVANLKDHSAGITSFAFSADGTRLASTARDGTWYLWDVATGERLGKYKSAPAHKIAFSPNGLTIAVTNSGPAGIELRDAASGASLGNLHGNTDSTGRQYTRSMDYSPNGQYIVAGYHTGKILIFDVNSRQVTAHFKDHGRPIEHVVFSPDGKRVLSGSMDGMIKVWDIQSGIPMTLSSPGFTSIDFSPDGKHVVTGSRTGGMEFWDALSGELLTVINLHSSNVKFALSPDGSRVVTSSREHTLKLWDTTSGKLLATVDIDVPLSREIPYTASEATILEHNYRVYSAVYSPDGTQIISGTGDQRVRYRGITSPPYRIRLSHDPSNNTIQWRNATSGATIQEMQEQGGTVFSVAISKNGNRFATASSDHKIGLWNSDTGELIAYFEEKNRGLSSMALSTDGLYLAAGGDEGSIHLTSTIPPWNEYLILHGHEDKVNSLALSADGQRILSGSDDQVVKLWEFDAHETSTIFYGHTASVLSVTFSPDERYVISGSADGLINLWDARTAELLASLSGHTGPVHSVAVSPDGQHIVSGSQDHTVRIWSLKSHKELATLRGHTGAVHSVVFSPDGRRILSSSEDKTVRQWHTRFITYQDNGQRSNEFQQLVERSFDVLGYKLDPVHHTLIPVVEAHFIALEEEVFSR